MADATFSYPHEAYPDIFKESLSYSEASTGFTAGLLEKDYYCSLLLSVFFSQKTSLVFKGGTCLAKIYSDFYRLSEDLDLIIPVAVDAPRNRRRFLIDPIKDVLDEISQIIPGIDVSIPFSGHNESRQYIGQIEYQSAVMDKQEGIKIEIGIREPLIIPSIKVEARTIAINPFTNRALFPAFKVQAMDIKEAYAEKVRAALTRRNPAIRDLFDLFYAVENLKMDFEADDFLALVSQKLEVPGNTLVDISPEYRQEIERQMEGQLRPVLRPADFNGFDIDKAFEILMRITRALSL